MSVGEAVAVGLGDCVGLAVMFADGIAVGLGVCVGTSVGFAVGVVVTTGLCGSFVPLVEETLAVVALMISVGFAVAVGNEVVLVNTALVATWLASGMGFCVGANVGFGVAACNGLWEGLIVAVGTIMCDVTFPFGSAVFVATGFMVEMNRGVVVAVGVRTGQTVVAAVANTTAARAVAVGLGVFVVAGSDGVMILITAVCLGNTAGDTVGLTSIDGLIAIFVAADVMVG